MKPVSLCLPVLLLAASLPLGAQAVISREVVQPLPSEEVQRLNRALVALAKAPRDLDALVEAGTAAMGIDDLEAARGFFARAADIDPNHPRVALGLAAIYLRSGRAAEAIPQFDRARAAGVPAREVLPDQALAFDLVGDQTAAQAAYAEALRLDPGNDEARRRQAVSYAIAGNRARFEEALRPLLDKRDMAALRARAFGLAILGDQARAAAIAEQVMPRDLSSRIIPYLAYMPRLTPAQQAAAANLGIFPQAADIGRDDPRLARLAIEAKADSRLEPAGVPLGQPAPPASAPARVAAAPAPAPAPMPARVGEAAPAPAPASEPVRPLRVAEAFADLGDDPLPDARVSGDAVDLTRITIRREAPPPPPKPKEPPKPVHPSRIWVQLATGKNLGALGFDWRRLSRSGGDLLAKLKPYTAPWGEAHRLLVGPIDGRDKAQALVRELKAKGLDSFLYVSPEGEEIQPVK
ncbi:SPOR domain-containing protein [Erythrobacter tepidarius]|uniref:SPOR domain-containing protein n=1 Tax=Erythrobacter tepidarius TaxID=60454 RepID=UPI000A398613|nr:SPOR domain-containing protein [Erythrobacter tepidarius]